MDSLTQIVLGAAVGEVALGKKVGNRALLWGAVGGTIPDLDVVTSVFLDPLQALSAHRGLSHSIVFAIIAAYILGWLIHHLYQSSYHRYVAVIGWLFIPVGVVYFISRIFDNASFNIISSIVIASVTLGAFVILYKHYFSEDHKTPPEASIRDWQWLMFWSLITHPLLDCFTTYGTQFFQPFSDLRVAFNAISVADPAYTLPFLICVVSIGFYNRNNQMRRRLSWIGIGVSSCYMMFCLINKQRVNKIWTDTLQSSGISYTRYMTSPAILSNFLWTCIAETEDGYVSGQYSIFDEKPIVKFEKIIRNDTGKNINIEDHAIERMRWFSDNYYSIIEHPEGLQFNDLRFGALTTKDGQRHYIFNFILKENSSSRYDMISSNGGPPPGEEQEIIIDLWERVKGI